MNSNNLKIAIQKKGRLTDETLSFLRAAGLEFELYEQKLYSKCRNFPLEILYVRDDDVLKYVSSGVVDMGIVGQNLLNEKMLPVKKILNLGYGYCSLNIAVPKESTIQTITQLKNKTIATSYPNATSYFFAEKDIPVTVVPLSGSVEIAPTLGIAQAIVDLVSSGSTLELNDLRILEKIFDSEAVLIANNKAKSGLINDLLTRFKAVLSAKNYKYVCMNFPQEKIQKVRKLIPNITNSNGTVTSVIKEEYFWEILEKLKDLGAGQISLQSVEKIIV
jgi:ATP phosphoribosyltransferase